MNSLQAKLFFIFLLILDPNPASSQQSISFSPTFGDDRLELNRSYFLPNGVDFFELSTLKFYISDLTFWDENKLVHALQRKYFLVDLDNPKSLTIDLNTNQPIEYKTIKFKVGIDSATSVSGAMGDDLDPTNGMYWTWQSGYINAKIEGTSTNCPARKNKFQFHLGGYSTPFYGMREIELIVSSQEKWAIELDFIQFFNSLDLSKTYQIMSPNAKAMQMATDLQSLFKITQ
jgi:hypothetical protein